MKRNGYDRTNKSPLPCRIRHLSEVDLVGCTLNVLS